MQMQHFAHIFCIESVIYVIMLVLYNDFLEFKMENGQLLTANEAFNMAMNTHPSLYASDSIENSKFMFFDHVFNTIGNGCRSIEDFNVMFGSMVCADELKASFPDKYITSEPLYYGYTKSKTVGSMLTGDSNFIVDGLFTKDEILNDSTLVDVFVQANRPIYASKDSTFNERLVPYPNFKKEYSLVWKDIFNLLDDSWKIEAINFYEKCKDFFEGSDSDNYSRALPKAPILREKVIKAFEDNFNRYKTEGQTLKEFHEEISKQYLHKYDGDTEKFVEELWALEKSRILEFIDGSIAKIQDSLQKDNIKK